MLKRIARWWTDWEQEQINVLDDPRVADTLAPGYRRYAAQKIGELSQIERQQLRDFSVTFRGRRLWIALAKLMLAFSAAGLLVHVLFPSPRSLPYIVIMANLIGFTVAMTLISVWFNYRKIASNKPRVLLRIVLWAMAGIVAGAVLSYADGDKSLDVILGDLPRRLVLATLGAMMLVGVPLVIIGAFQNRHYEALTLQLQLEAERERMARELSESQLRLLRAQIEPHFLFNTLGAVQQLAEHRAPEAASLTANLIAFLRASLTEMRSDQARLSEEFKLADAYLQVMQPRLGARLRYRLDLPEALEAVSMPSMILLTLVENAIKHGIEPTLRGGDVHVSAVQAGANVVIRVVDSGAGMSSSPGAGVGLENVRHRLQLVHGEAASLTLSDNLDGAGITAEIVIPHPPEQKTA
ncbi:sensor histidine kinase [Massilia soli]|uniref:histidine kinase n=1 Tax=Massilia soli TaxID=2792854 RepID=A0ABS7SP71_9BURK|nr:histidine kinase [Massilia soli]MBZ2207981.1 histidine kinase [Massilia soli]